MKSRLADEIRREQRAEVKQMTAGERVAAARSLGERAICDYTRNFGVGREEAIRALRRAGSAGRRYSACHDGDLDDGRDSSGR